MTKHKFRAGDSNPQPPLAPQNLCADATQRQDAPPVNAISSGWPDVAVDLSPRYIWVLAGVLQEAIRTGGHSKDQVEQILRRYCWDCPLPQEASNELSISIARIFRLVTEHKANIEAFFRNLGPARHTNAVYEVFHHGQLHTYRNEVPAEILSLRDDVLFWIDHSRNEWRSHGQDRGKGERLQPKDEEMLRFFCQLEHAGHRISLSKLYASVWKKTILPPITAVRNNIGVHQNTINAFAGEEFITKVPTNSQQDERRIYRLRGKDAYRIGTQASGELCIIRSFFREPLS